MFKRVIWVGAGFGAGLGSSYWVKRAVTRKVDRYVSPDVRAVVGTKAKAAGRTVRIAVREGRATMEQYQREAEAQVARPAGRLRAVPD